MSNIQAYLLVGLPVTEINLNKIPNIRNDDNLVSSLIDTDLTAMQVEEWPTYLIKLVIL